MRGVPAALDGRKGLRMQGFAALKRYGKFLLMREKEKNMRQIDTVHDWSGGYGSVFRTQAL